MHGDIGCVFAAPAGNEDALEKAQLFLRDADVPADQIHVSTMTRP